MTAPANNDAAQVREAELVERLRGWEASLGIDLTPEIEIARRLAAAAERAEKEEVAKVNAWERRDELEAALLAAQQELTRERVRSNEIHGTFRALKEERREAEATITRLREGGVGLIATERERQTGFEGYTPEHDEHHIRGELAMAAASYALPHRTMRTSDVTDQEIPETWPEWWQWKPGPDRVRELVKAGALIAAEIDRLLAQDAEQA